MAGIPTLKIVVYRKALHVFFCMILLSPYLPFFSLSLQSYGFTPMMFYSLLTIIAATINAVQIKKPLIRLEIKNLLQEKRRNIMEELLRMFPAEMPILAKYEERLRKLEDHFNEYVDKMERSYEKIGGYIGITHGIIGVLVSNILFGKYVVYGILALMIIDPITAVIGTTFGKYKIPKVEGSFEGSTIGFSTFFLFLLLLGCSLDTAFVISLVAVLTELVAIEDNLFIPILTSASAYFMQAVIFA